MNPDYTSKIQEQSDFIEFLEALSNDFSKNKSEWENTDLASFLEAMKAWLEDSDGFYENNSEDGSEISEWRRIADCLAAARIYE